MTKCVTIEKSKLFLVIPKTISAIPHPYSYLVSHPLSLKLFCQLSLIPNTPNRASVKCQQRNARTSAILSVFPKPRESASLQKSCYVAGSITSQSFPDFLNLSESCREKAVFVQCHNTSLYLKLRQAALELTPKGLDYTQIGTLREPCITDL